MLTPPPTTATKKTVRRASAVDPVKQTDAAVGQESSTHAFFFQTLNLRNFDSSQLHKELKGSNPGISVLDGSMFLYIKAVDNQTAKSSQNEIVCDELASHCVALCCLNANVVDRSLTLICMHLLSDRSQGMELATDVTVKVIIMYTLMLQIVNRKVMRLFA